MRSGAQVRWRRSEDRSDRLVELSNALEPGSEGNIGERDRRGFDEGSGGASPTGPGQREGADTEFGSQQPIQMSSADVEPTGQALDPLTIDHAVVDRPDGPSHQIVSPIPLRRAGRCVGSASLAGSEPGGLRRCGGCEKRHVRPFGPYRCWAARSAVDPGGGDADDHPSVETGVPAFDGPHPGFERRIDGVGHAPILTAPEPEHERKSDITVDGSGGPAVDRCFNGTMLPTMIDFAARNTPIRPADRLGVALGLGKGRLWFKRDDLTGLAGGGNKARKLELLVGDAVDRNCDVLVTAGAAQSNHVRATGSAARASGLDCVAVMAEREPKTVPEGNLVLDDLFGVEIVWTTGAERQQAFDDTVERLRSQGRRPYAIPLGGSSPIGAAAYATCSTEIELALDAAGSVRPLLVTAVGTGGTHAGLVAGFSDHARVQGYDVAAVATVDEDIPPLADAVADLLGHPRPAGTLRLDRSQAQVPYGEPTDAVFEALRLVARTEGVVLDPVYSGRAMAGFIAGAKRGEFDGEGTIVFVHTGGMPALFTERYRPRFNVPA